jgi:uncharacterized protein
MTPHQSVALMVKMLKNIEAWLDKAAAHATAKKFEADVLAGSRLAPDAYDLARQIQAACDQVKYTAAYLGGKPPPSHPDTEKTIAELRQRISKCLSFVESVPEKDYAGGEERKVSPGWLGGKWLRGEDYLVELAIPNFFFHVTMVYAILRHNGVDVGKMDYIGSLSIRE